MSDVINDYYLDVAGGYIIELAMKEAIDQFKDENAKLRERVSELEELVDGKRYIPQEWYQLVTTENDKLRGLARDMHTLATDHGVYVRYPYCDAWNEKLAVIEKQMRELGIEVDG